MEQPTILEVLEGLKHEIEERIFLFEALLDRLPATSNGAHSAAAPGPVDTLGRHLSPAARRRIANAQKKRWANFRAQKNKNNAAAD